MNVLGVCKYQCLPSGKCNVSLFGECNVYIFSVDFGCFSTGYRHCEGLWEREEQVIFTLFFALTFRIAILLPQKRKFFCRFILQNLHIPKIWNVLQGHRHGFAVPPRRYDRTFVRITNFNP